MDTASMKKDNVVNLRETTPRAVLDKLQGLIDEGVVEGFIAVGTGHTPDGKRVLVPLSINMGFSDIAIAQTIVNEMASLEACRMLAHAEFKDA